MLAWLRNAFSGPSGKTAFVAVHASAGVGTFLGLSIYKVTIQHAASDPAGFGGAWIMVLGASAAAIIKVVVVVLWLLFHGLAQA